MRSVLTTSVLALTRTLHVPAARPAPVLVHGHGHAPPVAAADADEAFMSAALRQAEIAFAEGEVPIGAVLVHEGEILAAAYNRVEALRDASAHAEMLCARAAAADPRWSSWRLHDTTLYCTVEPCPMCLAALHAFRVERLVYGATNPRLGAIESALRPTLDTAHPYHALQITGGVLADEAGELMREFFRRRRAEPAYCGAEQRIPVGALEGRAPSGTEVKLAPPDAVGVLGRVTRAVQRYLDR